MIAGSVIRVSKQVPFTDYWVTSDGVEMSGDLPLHFPLSVTADGRGPAVGADFDHYICWCGYPRCVRWDRETGEPR